jgi:hypothetical protein
VKEIGVPGENYRPVANHWQTLIKVENKDLSQKSELESCFSLTYTCGSGITYPVYNYAMWNLFFNWKYTIVGFTTTYAIAVYHHLSCEFKSWWGVLDTTLCDKVCQWLTTDRWFSPGTPVSSTNKTECHDITEILLKVALSTINPNLNLLNFRINIMYM